MTVDPDTETIGCGNDYQEDSYIRCKWDNLCCWPEFKHRNSCSYFGRNANHPLPGDQSPMHRLNLAELPTENQKLIPTANPNAGSTYSMHCLIKPPWTGLKVVISPIEVYCKYTMNLIMIGWHVSKPAVECSLIDLRSDGVCNGNATRASYMLQLVARDFAASLRGASPYFSAVPVPTHLDVNVN